MKTQRLKDALETMAKAPDVLGCALVDMEGGMVWHAVGPLAELEAVVSSSSDYWRLHRRAQSTFQELGELRVATLMHRHGQIMVSECGHRMLLVLVTRSMGTIDWERWKVEHTRLAGLVNDL